MTMALRTKWDDDTILFYATSGQTRIGVEIQQTDCTVKSYLSRRSAKILRDWLTSYLKRTDTNHANQ
jgi:hypothetical protein